MNFYQIEIFLEVVKLGSVTKAAHKLLISQPAVTLHIRQLEREMNCKLINRERGKYSLTQEGKRFFRYAEYVCHENENVFSDIAFIRQGITGNLNLISTAIIGEFILPSILNDFKPNYPSININITLRRTLKIVEEVCTGQDIIGFPSGVLPKRESIETIEIGKFNNVFIVYPGHPLTLKNEVTLSDITGEPLIIEGWHHLEELKNIGIDLDRYEPRIIMATATGVLSAVEAKLGIGITSSVAIKKSEAMGLVKVINVKDFEVERQVHCIYRKDNLTSELTKDFVKYIQKYSQDHGFSNNKLIKGTNYK